MNDTYIKKKYLDNFIVFWTNILQPKEVIWILNNDNSFLLDKLNNNSLQKYIKLEARPNSYAFFSSVDDVARIESRTFICSNNNPGPTNNWYNPNEMYEILIKKLSGVMQNRTMYIIPFCLGKIGDLYSKYGIQITDSEYATLNMQIMTRVGQNVLDNMNEFIPCIHTVGNCDYDNLKWPSSSDKYITHFTDGINIDKQFSAKIPYIISYGSGYGGNALLSKKCYALRIASVLGKREGWLAEHCLILKIISPTKEVKYICASFPSACGKTNLAMISPNEQLKKEGWKFETIGDDIAWLFPINGKLYAMNIENGFFGVAPGTNIKSNSNAMNSLNKDCIFTNCGVYINNEGDSDVWWEGMTKNPPLSFTNWKGENNILPVAHSNSRYTCPIQNCPILANDYDKLVPIDAIIFGGRRSSSIPLVSKADNIIKGIFYGASLSSEENSSNSDAKIGNVRFDPMSMRPFIGYNVCDYFDHWIDIMGNLSNPPNFYLVNWFRKDENNNFLWPGFSENSLILKWIFDDANSNINGIFGIHPKPSDLNIDIILWNKLFNVTTDEIEHFKIDVTNFFDFLDRDNISKVPNILRNEIENL